MGGRIKVEGMKHWQREKLYVCKTCFVTDYWVYKRQEAKKQMFKKIEKEIERAKIKAKQKEKYEKKRKENREKIKRRNEFKKQNKLISEMESKSAYYVALKLRGAQSKLRMYESERVVQCKYFLGHICSQEDLARWKRGLAQPLETIKWNTLVEHCRNLTMTKVQLPDIEAALERKIEDRMEGLPDGFVGCDFSEENNEEDDSASRSDYQRRRD